MKQRAFIRVLMYLVGVTPWAALANQVDNSIYELSYRPQPHQSRFQAGFKYDEQRMKFTIPGVVKWRGQSVDRSLQLGYRYGLSEQFAVGIFLGYGETEIRSNTSEKRRTTHNGFDDIELRGIGRIPVSADGLVNAELSLFVSPEDEKEYNYNQDKKGNRYSGGHAVKPSLGYQHHMGPGKVFSNVSYHYNVTEKKSVDGQEITKTKGGHIFEGNLGYEMSFHEKHNLGFYGGYLNTGRSKDKTTEPGIAISTDRSGIQEYWKVGSYFHASLDKNISFVPNLYYLAPLQKLDGADVDLVVAQLQFNMTF